MQFSLFTHLNIDADTVPVTVISVSWHYIWNADYSARVSTVIPKQNICNDYCKNFKPSASKSITYTDKVLHTVDCYSKQLRNVLKVLKHFLFLALQVLGYWSLVFKPNFVCYSRETKPEKSLCCLHFTVLYKPSSCFTP